MHCVVIFFMFLFLFKLRDCNTLLPSTLWVIGQSPVALGSFKARSCYKKELKIKLRSLPSNSGHASGQEQGFLKSH